MLILSAGTQYGSANILFTIAAHLWAYAPYAGYMLSVCYMARL